MNLANFQNLCRWHLFQPCRVQMKQISMLENQGKMLLEVPENNNEMKRSLVILFQIVMLSPGTHLVKNHGVKQGVLIIENAWVFM